MYVERLCGGLVCARVILSHLSPLPLLQFPVQPSERELVRVVFGEMRAGDFSWGLLKELIHTD